MIIIEWQKRIPCIPANPWPQVPYSPSRPITPAEINEFRKLLERAHEYDRKNSQPDCENEQKKQRLRELAKELGIEIEFPDENEK